MAKFKTQKGKEPQAINTSALPDIIFMLLFFFMVSTTMREVELNVDFKAPQATELQKLEKKSLVTYIYVGKPKARFHGRFGTEPRIQLNDVFASIGDIQNYIATEREAMKESDRPKMTTSLKISKETKMGIVTDIKQALRRANALKINYSAAQKGE